MSWLYSQALVALSSTTSAKACAGFDRMSSDTKIYWSGWKLLTDEAYEAFDGGHCKRLWKETPEYWRCPSCLRTKRELMVWGRPKHKHWPNPNPPKWKVSLARHHDHGGSRDGVERFPETLICGQCNGLDPRLKEALKIRGEFSFSAQEMSWILKHPVEPNCNIEREQIDFEVAEQIAREVGAFDAPSQRDKRKAEYEADQETLGDFRDLVSALYPHIPQNCLVDATMHRLPNQWNIEIHDPSHRESMLAHCQELSLVANVLCGGKFIHLPSPRNFKTR